MKRIVAGLFLAALALAQTPNPTDDLARSYAALSQPVSNLIVAYNISQNANQNLGDYIKTLEVRVAVAEAAAKTEADKVKVAWVDGIDAKCASCRPAIDLGLTGLSGDFTGTLICCGINTVPPTPIGTAIVYITRRP